MLASVGSFPGSAGLAGSLTGATGPEITLCNSAGSTLAYCPVPNNCFTSWGTTLSPAAVNASTIGF